MSAFEPCFTITNAITAGLTTIERAQGFLQAATLSEEWVRRMSQRALLLEAHHTTHIEGTQLTLEQSERVWAGEDVAEAQPGDVARAAELPRRVKPRPSHPFVDGNGCASWGAEEIARRSQLHGERTKRVSPRAAILRRRR